MKLEVPNRRRTPNLRKKHVAPFEKLRDEGDISERSRDEVPQTRMC